MYSRTIIGRCITLIYLRLLVVCNTVEFSNLNSLSIYNNGKLDHYEGAVVVKLTERGNWSLICVSRPLHILYARLICNAIYPGTIGSLANPTRNLQRYVSMENPLYYSIEDLYCSPRVAKIDRCSYKKKKSRISCRQRYKNSKSTYLRVKCTNSSADTADKGGLRRNTSKYRHGGRTTIGTLYTNSTPMIHRALQTMVKEITSSVKSSGLASVHTIQTTNSATSNTTLPGDNGGELWITSNGNSNNTDNAFDKFGYPSENVSHDLGSEDYYDDDVQTNEYTQPTEKESPTTFTMINHTQSTANSGLPAQFSFGESKSIIDPVILKFGLIGILSITVLSIFYIRYRKYQQHNRIQPKII